MEVSSTPSIVLAWDAMYSKLDKYYELSNDYLLYSTILDPRFNLSYFERTSIGPDDENPDDVKRRFVAMIAEDYPDLCIQQQNPENMPPSNSLMDSLFVKKKGKMK